VTRAQINRDQGAVLTCGGSAVRPAALLRGADRPWWERPPASDLTTSIGRIDYRDPAELCESHKPVQRRAPRHHGDVRRLTTNTFLRLQGGGKQNPDYLARYVPEAKKRGIRVLIYFNVHWYATAFAEKHPDWRQILRWRRVSASRDGTTAEHSVAEWCPDPARSCRLSDRRHFHDTIFRADTCYCRYCREKFRTLWQRDAIEKARQGRAFQN
jgi:hypothetical protein